MSRISCISEELLKQCVRCGACRAVCPVFRVLKEEPAVARGKIFLAHMINTGELKPGAETTKVFNLCTTCLQCAKACPALVDYENLIVSARAVSARASGIPIEKRALITVLSKDKLTRAVKGALNLLFRVSGKAEGAYGKLFRLPAVGGVLLPEPKGFKGQEKWFKAKRERGRVAFFAGCLLLHFMGRTAGNVIKLLNAVGYSVLVPAQKCCGAPAYYSGDIKTFERLREENLKLLQKERVDCFVTACATCGHVLKEHYSLPAPVKELVEILLENRETLSEWKYPERVKVTWHNPCHLVRGQKIPENAFAEVLKPIENILPVEMATASECCGMGGSFKVSYPDISERIQAEKVRRIKESGADILLTECPGCLLNIAEGLEKAGSTVAPMHTADLLIRCTAR